MALKLRALCLLLAVFPFLGLAADLPDLKLTPGTINSSVTQQNIHSTVCVKGYTKTIRPPAYYTNKLKKKQLESFGYADKNPAHYEEDHLIPLSIGGNPSDEENLWPQPRISEWGASKKDVLELKLYKLVCDETITLDEARKEISVDWIKAYKKYIGN